MQFAKLSKTPKPKPEVEKKPTSKINESSPGSTDEEVFDAEKASAAENVSEYAQNTEEAIKENEVEEGHDEL